MQRNSSRTPMMQCPGTGASARSRMSSSPTGRPACATVSSRAGRKARAKARAAENRKPAARAGRRVAVSSSAHGPPWDAPREPPPDGSAGRHKPCALRVSAAPLVASCVVAQAWHAAWVLPASEGRRADWYGKLERACDVSGRSMPRWRSPMLPRSMPVTSRLRKRPSATARPEARPLVRQQVLR